MSIGDRTFRLAPALALVLAAAACSGEARPPAAGAASAPDDGPAAPPRVENVLLITVDTLRADAVGFAGAPVATPALDRLAAGGRVFTRAYAHNVVTLPSHANILTGLYPWQHGVRDNGRFALGAEPPTAAEHFAAAGFATAAVVAAFPLTARYGLARGFELYDDELSTGWGRVGFGLAERPGGEVVERGREWWRAHDGRRRFLWLHLFEPHGPYEPGEPFASRYADPYLGEVALTDHLLAPLLAPFLEGREGPTLIVFTSDHGEGRGDHGEATHGTFAYDSTLRVPLVLWAPGLAPGRREDVVRHVDLLPTLLAAAGVPVPGDLPGRSLLGPAPAAPVSSYLEALTPFLAHDWAPLRGVLRGDHKLIALPVPELYDLARDPGETENLFTRRRDLARDLAALLPEEADWPPRPRAPTAAESRALAALGYLEGGGGRRTQFTEADDPKRLIELDRMLHAALAAIGEGRPDRAEALAREVISRRPTMTAAYTLLGQILAERERWSEVVATLSAAVAAGIDHPPLVAQLGRALVRVGEPARAVTLLEPFAGSREHEALTALATALTEAGELERATAVLERALALDGDDPIVLESLALVALRRGRWAECERHARRALAIDDGLSLAWNYLGGALFNQGRATEAVAALERSVAADRSNFDALFNLALIANAAGDADRARAALERFVAEAPPERYGADIERARGWLAGGLRTARPGPP